MIFYFKFRWKYISTLKSNFQNAQRSIAQCSVHLASRLMKMVANIVLVLRNRCIEKQMEWIIDQFKSFFFWTLWLLNFKYYWSSQRWEYLLEINLNSLNMTLFTKPNEWFSEWVSKQLCFSISCPPVYFV